MMRSGKHSIILASVSPRRKKLLEEMGFSVRVHPSLFDEKSLTVKNPAEFAVEAAYNKGKDVAPRYPHHVTVAADTVVTIDQQILGKPADREEAIGMLRLLNGKHHDVITGLSLFYPDANREYSGYEETRVIFRDLSNDEIEKYVDLCRPYDKAGAYGIQEITIPLVRKIDGSYFNVVGFPISHFYIHWREIVKTEP
jgi:septum formation protein